MLIFKLHKKQKTTKCVESKQTYLAMGNLLNVAAELKIDVSPMEGFVPEK
jgi:nitroreductase